MNSLNFIRNLVLVRKIFDLNDHTGRMFCRRGQANLTGSTRKSKKSTHPILVFSLKTESFHPKSEIPKSKIQNLLPLQCFTKIIIPMKIKNLLTCMSAVVLLGTGCVSTQKYNDMKTARDHFRTENENLKAMQSENTELQNKLRVAEGQLQQLKTGLDQQKTELARIKQYNQELSLRFEEAAKENAKLLSSYSTEKTTFEQRIANSQDEMLRQERQLQGLEQTIGLQSYSMESMRTDLASREQRVAELEKLVAEKEAQMEQLRLSLSNALRGYNAADLTIEERSGKIYVSLSQNLLFKTGSDKVDAKGEQALVQLAKALNDNPNIEIIVEGHTDNTGGVDYNWDLSTRRATAVVKILAINSVAPGRLVASGRGMHHPVVPNTTEENKAKNRRTEIILSPNLDKIFELSK